MKRTIAAFMIAPLIPAVVFMPSAGAVVAIGYSYAFSYILGMPVFFLFRKKKRESHLLYGSLGFVIGALYVLVPAISDIRMFDSSGVIASLMFATIGAAVALCFSVVRGPERRRPIQRATDNDGAASRRV